MSTLELPEESYGGIGHNSLDEWFAGVALPWLEGEASKADLFMINVNLKYRIGARRSDRDGIALLQHLRLTKTLPNPTRQRPVVLYTFENPTALSEKDPSNLVVFSPGVTLLRLPEGCSKLSDARALNAFAQQSIELSDPRQSCLFRLDPLGTAPAVYGHSYRNRVGVAKFLCEFAGDVVPGDHPLLKDLSRCEKTDLQLKRLMVSNPLYEAGTPPLAQEAQQFREVFQEHRFLYIDDEHHRGWSLALCAGLTGQCDAPPPADYNDSVMARERLRVLGSYETARRLIDSCATTFANCFQSWTRTSQQLQERTQRMDELRQKAQRLETARKEKEQQYKKASDERSQAEVTRRQKWTILQQSLGEFAKLAYAFVDQSTTPQAREEIAVQVLEQNRQSITNLAAFLDRFSTASRMLQDKQEAEQKAEASAKAARDEFEDAQRQLKAAEIDVTEARVACEKLARCLLDSFPYSIVFLDLRLQPEDETRPVDRLSGWEILYLLRTHFPHVPVMIFTASEKAVSAETARQRGAVSYWIKGISSGHELREQVRLLQPKLEMREIWYRLQRVRGKTSLHAYEYSVAASIIIPRYLSSGHPERETIESLLEQAYWLLWHNDGVASGASSPPGEPWNSVVRILGIVQEFRLKGVRDQLWNQLWLPQQERDFRRLRSDVIHPGRLPASSRTILRQATRKEALDFFSYSLNQLLEP
jgi:CheY-like chemotaxis protein